MITIAALANIRSLSIQNFLSEPKKNLKKKLQIKLKLGVARHNFQFIKLIARCKINLKSFVQYSNLKYKKNFLL